jgi:hypothetical protein
MALRQTKVWMLPIDTLYLAIGEPIAFTLGLESGLWGAIDSDSSQVIEMLNY